MKVLSHTRPFVSFNCTDFKVPNNSCKMKIISQGEVDVVKSNIQKAEGSKIKVKMFLVSSKN